MPLHTGPRAEEMPPPLPDNMRLGAPVAVLRGWKTIYRDQSEETLLLYVD